MSKAKKRKTRKEKILADLHRKIKVVEESAPISAHIAANLSPKKVITVITEPKKSNNLNKYPYLMGDVRKTAVVTSSIITFQIILFIVLKFQVIKLPGIIY